MGSDGKHGRGRMSAEPVTLHRVSPCEHGITHPIRELLAGSSFSVRECRTKAGMPRNHVVTTEKYPDTVRR